MSQVILKLHNLKIAATATVIDFPTRTSALDLKELWNKGFAADPISKDMLKALEDSATKSRHLTLSQCSERQGRLLYQERVYVPDHAPLKLRLIRDHHDTATTEHSGRVKMLELLA